MSGNVDYAGERKVAANFSQWRVIAALSALLLLVAAIAITYHGAQKRVKLLVDGEQVEVKTFVGDVRGLLEENAVAFGETDSIVPQLDTPLEDGMVVTVRHTVPVTLKVGETERQLVTLAETVNDLLKQEGVEISKLDEVSPSLDTILEPGLTIQVDKVTTRVIEEDVYLPNKIIRENDDSLFRGIIKVVQQGSRGLERKKWEIVYKNNQEIEKRLLASSLVKEPVDRVIKVGTLQTVSRGGNQIRFTRAYDMVATAYTYTGNNTSTGVPPRVGMAAVDPGVIPLGSRLFVDGYGYCRAMDVGSKIKGNRIDLFMETRNQALSWGRKTVKVYLLE